MENLVKQGPLVSVLMNCYNGEAYLHEAIRSVIDQTYKNWELIFWDNQSSDTSASIVQSYDDPRIFYFRSDEHTLLGEGRRRAIRKASGEWIGFLDCDDVWMSDKLEKQIRRVLESQNDDVVLVYSKYFNLYSDSKKVLTQEYDLPEGKIASLLLRKTWIGFPTLLVKKAAYDRVGGFPGSFAISLDYYLEVRLAEYGTVLACQEPLAYYRIHDSNLSSKKYLRTIYEDLLISLRFWYLNPFDFIRNMRDFSKKILRITIKGNN
ncbi:glycosyltransferase [Leptospira gomenensis]|uniref:Glycosyltransferase n=1 Tax=Leptospira gomenensis TaxID=2484974 RepID=A0A5F1YSV5_9LEPT|nr:glycosyltransferase [Leptospira gomenensis]TGK30913.1 glycosyltransferase [Leptospira gomenensis]TGK32551.1 glycosyltransferase [Leptospira gomenensis]TGK45367.1 glycosyltransferase [Leptospira gomenensis]TGK60641.1 glycosyltransferase [Leptospira gomenensis]